MKAQSNSRGGFTLIESLIAIGVIVVIGCVGMDVISTANRNASSGRTYTAAEEAVRDQIDLITTATPFSPQGANPQVNPVLALGTTTTTVPLYIDPGTLTSAAYLPTASINGTMTTLIEDVSPTSAPVFTCYRATVTLTYNIGRATITLTRHTLRTTDN